MSLNDDALQQGGFSNAQASQNSQISMPLFFPTGEHRT